MNDLGRHFVTTLKLFLRLPVANTHFRVPASTFHNLEDKVTLDKLGKSEFLLRFALNKVSLQVLWYNDVNEWCLLIHLKMIQTIKPLEEVLLQVKCYNTNYKSDGLMIVTTTRVLWKTKNTFAI